MNPKKFRSVVDVTHKKYMCETFHYDYTFSGIDFLFGDMAIELKSKLQFRPTVGFMLDADQIREWETTYKTHKLFWMLLIYDLDKPVKSVRVPVERSITARRVWILPWNFVKQIPELHFACGNFKWVSQKSLPLNLDKIQIGTTTFNVCDHPRVKELFDRREFLL